MTSVTVFTLLGALAWVQPGRAYADQTLSDTGIRTQQLSVVAANYREPLNLARFAVAEYSAAVTADSQHLQADQSAQAAAAARAAEAAARLGHDEDVLAAATRALAAAETRLELDRAQLRAIAVGMYTGALTNPQPTSLRELEAEQAQVIDAAEAGLVASIVDDHVHSDVATAAQDGRRKDEDTTRVNLDSATKARETAEAAAAAARTTADEKTLATDRTSLAEANRRLDTQEAALASALASVAGPVATPPGQLSLLGASALNASELVGWYNAQGYVDLTSASIQQLAGWYIQAGAREGVRGDVAFAQAVLETGGFSSPDAVDLSNFAGIGHCDTCAAGWAFPSPEAGVLGQIQLLRIFADSGPGPANAPPPVLPSLSPGRQMSAGRCPTVESLTGVWATDPAYAQDIMLIYGQMLSYALGGSTTN